MNFPLHFRFKLLALVRQVSVTDSAGNLVYYVRQKAFKLKEDVRVFADEEQTRELHRISADRVIDISARYDLADENGTVLGQVQRRGMKSLWRAHYEIHRDGKPVMLLHEESGWIKVLDSLFGEIPVIGLLSGYLFHPSYLVTRADTDTVVARIEKLPAFFEGRFRMDRIVPLDGNDEKLAVLSTIMMLLLERSRG